MLSRQLGVSIGTVRRAVDDLVAERIVVCRQGRGTFVAPHNSDRFLFQLFHGERSDGLSEATRAELLRFERAHLDEDGANALRNCLGDRCFRIGNRLRLPGRPVVHDHLQIPAIWFKGLTERRWRERPSIICHVYQMDFGITVVRALGRLRAAAASDAAAHGLGVATGSPVLEVRRTAIALKGRPVEYRVSTVLTREHEYVNMLPRLA